MTLCKRFIWFVSSFLMLFIPDSLNRTSLIITFQFRITTCNAIRTYVYLNSFFSDLADMKAVEILDNDEETRYHSTMTSLISRFIVD